MVSWPSLGSVALAVARSKLCWAIRSALAEDREREGDCALG